MHQVRAALAHIEPRDVERAAIWSKPLLGQVFLYPGVEDLFARRVERLLDTDERVVELLAGTIHGFLFLRCRPAARRSRRSPRRLKAPSQ
jgi:hypothetical protein